MKPTAQVFVTLILLASAVSACGPKMAAATPTPTSTSTPVPATPTSTITPTPVLNLEELAVRVCSFEGFPAAAALGKDPSVPRKIFLVDQDDKEHPMNKNIPANMQARSVAELEAVVCMDKVERDRDASPCGSYSMLGQIIKLSAGSYVQSTWLVEARTGRMLDYFKARSKTSSCPDSISSKDPRLIDGVFYGSEITWDDIWFAIEILTFRPTVVPTPTITPTRTPFPTSRPGQSIAGWSQDFLEDFSPTYSGWDEAPGETTQDGVLRWRVQSASPVYHSRIARPSSFAKDIHARLVVRHTQGLASDAYGLVFRSKDEANHLDFLIRDDGTFELWASGTPIIQQPSDAIRPGDWNTLEVTDTGPSIYLAINGTPVASLDLEDPAWGQVGLAVNLSEEGVTNYDSTFEFDELEVLEP